MKRCYPLPRARAHTHDTDLSLHFCRFSKFRTATKEELVDLLGFLQEFCSLAKNLQIPQQRDFYQYAHIPSIARWGLLVIPSL
jgi:hypothetical protein